MGMRIGETMYHDRNGAEKQNGHSSTGPRTATGKAIASRNAQRHGIFSNCLILEDEDPNEFAVLVNDLRDALLPVRALELTLVERIAVTVWRKRRLVAAETAALHLSRCPHQVAGAVSSELGRSYSKGVSENELASPDTEQVEWCRKVIEEIESLEAIELSSVEQLAPLSFEQLKEDAKSDEQEPIEYLEDYSGGLTSYLVELLSGCRKTLAEADERPRILDLADKVRLQRLVLPEATLQLLSRYQTMLDNQVYKALKALREAQEWRLQCLDTVSVADDSSADAHR